MPTNISKIARSTDKKRKKKSKLIKVKLKKVGKKMPKRWPGTWNVWFMYDAQSQNTPGKKYSVILQTIEDKGVTVDNWNDLATGKFPLMISCQCADWKFRWEKSNQVEGNSMILYSNGDLPTTTNPEMKQWMCKHVLQCYKQMQTAVKRTTLNNINDIRTQDYYDK